MAGSADRPRYHPCYHLVIVRAVQATQVCVLHICLFYMYVGIAVHNDLILLFFLLCHVQGTAIGGDGGHGNSLIRRPRQQLNPVATATAQSCGGHGNRSIRRRRQQQVNPAAATATARSGGHGNSLIRRQRWQQLDPAATATAPAGTRQQLRRQRQKLWRPRQQLQRQRQKLQRPRQQLRRRQQQGNTAISSLKK